MVKKFKRNSIEKKIEESCKFGFNIYCEVFTFLTKFAK